MCCKGDQIPEVCECLGQHVKMNSYPRTSVDEHQRAVNDIAAQVRQYHERGEKFRIFHGSTNSTRQKRKSVQVIDTSSLSNVLMVDPEVRTLRPQSQSYLPSSVMKLRRRPSWYDSSLTIRTYLSSEEHVLISSIW